MKLRTIICRNCGPKPFHAFIPSEQGSAKGLCRECRGKNRKKYRVRPLNIPGWNWLRAREEKISVDRP